MHETRFSEDYSNMSQEKLIYLLQQKDTQLENMLDDIIYLYRDLTRYRDEFLSKNTSITQDLKEEELVEGSLSINPEDSDYVLYVRDEFFNKVNDKEHFYTDYGLTITNDTECIIDMKKFERIQRKKTQEIREQLRRDEEIYKNNLQRIKKETSK
jgi:hypothetical protein